MLTAADNKSDQINDQTTGGQMQAIVQDRYGTADVWSLGSIDRPTPDPDQVLIEVHAAGLDRGTWHLMTGLPYLVRLAGFGMTKPKNRVPGLDVAGRVVATGSAVTRFNVDDEVFGIGAGSFAEYAVADEAKIVHKPSNVSYEHAAVSAVSGITALQALTDSGQLEAGQRVLVIGASGGVGTFAVQLARALGATVDGVAGTSNLELVRSLGAQEVFDYKQTSLADIAADIAADTASDTASDTGSDMVRQYDLVIDAGGLNSLSSLRGLLTESGTLVIVGGEGGNRVTGGIGRQLRAAALSPLSSQRLTMLISSENHGDIDRLARHLESGAVVPAIGGRFQLSEAREAMRQMQSGKSTGKSVIVVR